MLNKLSLVSTVSLLVMSSACIINADDEGGDDSTSSDSNTTNGTSSSTSTSSGTSTSTSSTTASDETSSGGGSGESGAEGTTGAGAACGWGRTGDPEVPMGYICDGDGEDPAGGFPIDCPEGVELVDGGPCANGEAMIEGPGCCDANGDLWYCQTDGQSEPTLVTEDC
jgi:hypothetical protein